MDLVYALPVISNIAILPLITILLQNVNRFPIETIYVIIVYTVSFVYHMSYAITQSWEIQPTKMLQFIDHLFANGLVVLILVQFFFWYHMTLRYITTAILLVPVSVVYAVCNSTMALYSVAALAFFSLFFVPHMTFRWYQWGVLLCLSTIASIGYMMHTGIEYAIGHSMWHIASFLAAYLISKWGVPQDTVQPGLFFLFIWVTREHPIPMHIRSPLTILKVVMQRQWRSG